MNRWRQRVRRLRWMGRAEVDEEEEDDQRERQVHFADMLADRGPRPFGLDDMAEELEQIDEELPVARPVHFPPAADPAVVANNNAMVRFANAGGIPRRHRNRFGNNNDVNIPLADVHIPRPFRLRGAPASAVLFEEICQFTSESHEYCPRGACARIVQLCQQQPHDTCYLRPSYMRTVFHQAAYQCTCVHVWQALVEAVEELPAGERGNVDPFTRDTLFQTPLHLFFDGLHKRQWPVERIMPTLEAILATAPPDLVTAVDWEGCTVLHFACGGNGGVPAEAVVRLLEATPTPEPRPAGNATAATPTLHRQNRYQQFPLHLYCARRDATVDLARRLVEGHPAALRAVDNMGWTPLHHAAARCNGPLIQYLVEADAHAASRRSSSQQETPLHVLCRHKPSCDLLPALRALKQAAPEAAQWRTSNSRGTPLHALCASPTVSLLLIEALLEDNTAVARVTAPTTNMVPLHVACEVGLPFTVIQVLVRADPYTVRAVTHKNDTPLSLACANHHHDYSRETVELLLSEYPKAALVANSYGYLPLHGSVRAYQPHRTIVAALARVAPQSLTATTHGGETALHLLTNNTSASPTLWHELQSALKKHAGTLPTSLAAGSATKKGLPTFAAPFATAHSTKLGNTPLHNACFRGATLDQLEGLAIHHPSWLSTANSAGHTPLQILCKSGHLNAEKLTLFSRLGGPGLFSTVDETGNTPLHSALRTETDLSCLLALIQACPKSLHMKTCYDDTPLHLACLRKLPADVVHAVAVATCCGMETTLAHCNQRISPILLANTAGQTPVAIAIEEYQNAMGVSSSCSSGSSLRGDQQRAFDMLATLVKLLHYGPGTKEEAEGQNLVFACLCLHRKNVRLPPAFIRRVLSQVPEQVGQMDEDGNYPLHVEAGIPMEKMSLLDASWPRCCDGECAQRAGILRLLLDIYPQAASQRNAAGYFPLAMMVQNGRPWDSTFTWLLRVHPQAFHWVSGVTPQTVSHILARVGETCGQETMFALLKSRPDMLFANSNE